MTKWGTKRGRTMSQPLRKFLGSMEGAIFAGKLAAEVVACKAAGEPTKAGNARKVVFQWESACWDLNCDLWSFGIVVNRYESYESLMVLRCFKMF